MKDMFTRIAMFRIACCLAALYVTFGHAKVAQAAYIVQATEQSQGDITDDSTCNLSDAIDCANLNTTCNASNNYHGCGDGGPDNSQIYLSAQIIGGQQPVYLLNSRQTITRTDTAVTINGSEETTLITIQGSGTSDIFTVNSGGNLYINYVVLNRSGTTGRIISNSGNLTLWAVYVTGGNVGSLTCNGTTTTGCGGGIYNAGEFSISWSRVFYNSAVIGGGLYNAPGGHVNVDNSTIGAEAYYANAHGTGGNTASGDGGGIYNNGGSGIDMHYSTISYNTSGGNGGGMMVSARTRITVSTIAYNKALNGGGIYVNIPIANYIENYATTVAYNMATTTGSGASQTGGGVVRVAGQSGNSICQDSLYANNTRNNGATPSDYFGNPDANQDTLYQCYFGVTTDTVTRSGFTQTNNGTLSNLSSTLALNGGFTRSLALSAGPATGYTADTYHRALSQSYDQTFVNDPALDLYDFGSYEFSWR
jgi:hypothetical protein